MYAAQNHLPIPIGKNISQNLDDYLEDSDTDNDGEGSNLLNLILKEETYLKGRLLIQKMRKDLYPGILLLSFRHLGN